MDFFWHERILKMNSAHRRSVMDVSEVKIDRYFINIDAPWSKMMGIFTAKAGDLPLQKLLAGAETKLCNMSSVPRRGQYDCQNN